ncbi:ABC transporter permease [Brevibacillus fortis]|uniref:ABC transporter permease n=1 Tax=Brevibacillus fortis TaxID=2126352 RepID=A0A2P7UIE0_9BACL|nr:ABC transporter permease [Brevibacillus fortis]PSJ86774.1 ABC transporter permease [Brevibacillus fortis]
MNIWNIAVKEIKSSLREKRTFMFMLALPLILMLILGSALSNAFDDTRTVGDMRLLYKSDGTNEQVSTGWHAFITAIENEGVEVVQAGPGTDGNEEVRADRYTGYAVVSDDGIEFYGSSKNAIGSNILAGMLTVFADRYSLASAAYQVDPETALATITTAGQNDEFIRETTLHPNKKPRSIDYYAMAMTTMIGLYAMINASYLFSGERTNKTAIRLMAAPVSKGAIFTGKVIGCTVINLFFVLVVFLVSKFVFQADWGNHYGMVILVLLTEVVLAVSLGLGISFLFKGEGIRAINNIFTQVASFAGGAYFPIDQSGGFISLLSNFSPLHWVNTGLMQIIYTDNPTGAWFAITMNVSFATAFIIFSVFTVRRREGAFV